CALPPPPPPASSTLSLHDALPISRRAVKISSAARAAPTRRGSSCVPPPPGITPTDTSGSPSTAVPSATITSQDRASSKPPPRARSEEHTSELQSRENLVCRLLLEK